MGESSRFGHAARYQGLTLGRFLVAVLILGQTANTAEDKLKADRPEWTARQIIEKAREAAKRNGMGETRIFFFTTSHHQRSWLKGKDPEELHQDLSRIYRQT